MSTCIENKGLNILFENDIDSTVLELDRINRVMSVQLLTEEKIGIQLKNNMIDLDERLEVGELIVTKIIANNETVKKIQLNEPFKINSISALLLNIKNRKIMSGIKINGIDSEYILIIAADSPCSLVIKAPFFSSAGVPEYSIDEYEEEILISH